MRTFSIWTQRATSFSNSIVFELTNRAGSLLTRQVRPNASFRRSRLYGSWLPCIPYSNAGNKRSGRSSASVGRAHA